MNPRYLAILLLSATLTACGGGGGSGDGGMVPDACSVSAEKAFVRDATNEWYLFPELLPAQVNPGDFATAQELLDFMTATARAQGKDRYFSYVTTKEADNSFLQEGQFIGFGFRFSIDPVARRAFFMDAFENSPASEAGLGRGDELLEVNSGSGWVPVANLLTSDPALSGAFGPAEVGVQRGFRFLKAGTASPVVEASLTKRIVTIEPIPDDGVRILTLPDNPAVEVGYVNLRSYISTAEVPLRGAFRQFAERGITDVVVDLRYNGGGLISVANLMGDLMGALRQPTDVYNNIRFRPSKASYGETRYFRPISGTSVDAVSIAFITTAASASASELTVNAMKPWADVAIIGSDTYGKPVGQSAFDLSDRCQTRLRLVTLRSTNADDEGDYYNGLAETLPGRACSADDDLSRPMGDPLEASTAEALDWIATGACASLISGVPAAQKPSLRQELIYPVPERPSPAQVYLPGLY